MKLELKDINPVLNGNTIYVKEITPDSFINLLDSHSRIVKLDMGISINIFDQLGIRFWERNNKVYEVEFLLEESIDKNCPREVFKGDIFLDDIQLPHPIFIETIKLIDTVEVVQDDDSKRFGLNIYHIKFINRRYSFWVNSKNEEVTSIHI